MANYSVNVNLPGVKSVFSSEPATPSSSSTIIPMFVVSLNPAKLQETLEGEIIPGTDPMALTIAVAEDYAPNAFAGQYVAVTSGVSSLIVQSSASDLDQYVELSLSRPITPVTVSGVSASIRTYEELGVPKLYTSVNSFAADYLDRQAAGGADWGGSENAFYTLQDFKAEGGTLFYVCPVADAAPEDAMAALPADATFQAKMLALSPQPDCICVPKQPILGISAADWATIDKAFMTYIENRGSDDTVDDALRQLFYVCDTPSVSVAAATLYRGTTLNSTSEKLMMYHGMKMASSLTRGKLQTVCPSPAICGAMNRVSTSAPESFGHAFEGRNYMSIGNLGMADPDLSPANRLTLISNGINPIISKPGLGSWVESQFTQKKNTTSSGGDPVESAHVVVGRAKIWNGLQPILASVISEPNVSSVRSSLLARVRVYMQQLQDASIITGFVLTDVTSSADVASGVVRYDLSVLFAKEIDYVELRLNAAFGG